MAIFRLNEKTYRIQEQKHPLFEMARLGQVDEIEIMVFGKEGPTPHFHFRNKSNHKYEKGCICINEASYFEHGHYNAKLNSKERKAVDAFLRKDSEYYKDITNYEVIQRFWKMSNPEWKDKVDLLQSQPDYKNL